MSQKNYFISDREVAEEFKWKGRTNPFIELIGTFLNNLLRAIPFSVKIFIRSGMGSRIIGKFTILFAFVWVWFILEGHQVVSQITFPSTIFEIKKGEIWYLPLALGWFIISVASQILYDLGIPIQEEYLTGWSSSTTKHLLLLHAVVILYVPIAGVVSRRKARRKTARTSHGLDTTFPGDSVFFSWLKNHRIKEDFILRWLDPLLVFSIALLFILVDDKLTIFFGVGALTLWWEETIRISKELDTHEAKLAGRGYAERVERKYGRKEENTKSGNAVVSFVSRKEQSSYLRKIRK